jgi:hypothetical protein
MHLEGPLENILVGCLPHEVTQSVLADFFGQAVPRWADEGAAIVSEDAVERSATTSWPAGSSAPRVGPFPCGACST